MDDQVQSGRLSPDALPRLRKGVRLTESKEHGGWVLLAPERVFRMNPAAAEIIRRCNGTASFGEITDNLSKTYGAPRDRIQKDIENLLCQLADKKLLDL